MRKIPLDFPKHKTFLINLKRRDDRLHQATLACHKIGLEFTLIKATDATTANLPKYIPSEEFEASRFNKAAYALAHTTAKILRKAIKEDLDQILIMEDDVVWHPKANELYSNCINQLPENWKLIHFSQMHQVPSPSASAIYQKTNNLSNPLITKLIHTYSCAAYVIKRDVFEAYLAFCENPDRPIDNWLIENYQGDNSVSYGTYPALAWQSSGHSDIQDGHLDLNARLKQDFSQ
jgi:GR25 family glycosyltransferase involved in LPS biosynthesis